MSKKFRLLMTASGLLLTATLLVSCQSLSVADFDNLEEGLTKNQVLDLYGNPNRTGRWKGKDQWTYIFVDKNLDTKLPQERHIYFEAGKTVKVTSPTEPKLSAEERDIRNETSNLQIEAKLIKEREAIRNPEKNVNKESGKSGFVEISGDDEEDDAGKTPSFKPID